MIRLGDIQSYPADRVHASPNWSTRPASVVGVQLVVIHATADEGDEAGAETWLTHAGSQVSAHLLFLRDGTVVRLVADRRKAWHAGTSTWRLTTGERVSDLNRISLGWEVANRNDGREEYTDAQYASLARAAAWYMRQGLAMADFVGHEDIAPGRKVDPGPLFDWSRFRVDSILARHAPNPVPQIAG